MTLWDLANAKRSVHRFSTLITAEQLQREFGRQEAIDNAIAWCKTTGVTKVYVESFRSAVQVEREILAHTCACFRDAGIDTCGCVTPTKVGKPSTRWKELISCYTDLATQENVRRIFEYAASVSDEIMIDDFWFTDCACPECNVAREARTVCIAGKTYPVSGDGWNDYRCELMVQLSRECVLAAAKRVNPKVKLIIKYPQWYDRFHVRGYEVIRESEDFDKIWVGTETRDFPGPFAGNMPQYEAYFIMRWLGQLGGAKCGGGWYDPYGTTPPTYIEQARQTVLGGARESLLFAYGSLLRDTGPANIEALRQHVPELLEVAEQVGKRKPIGIAAYKPANSQHLKEPFVYDFIGMLGFPLLPCHELPRDAAAVFLPTHALKDRDLARKLGQAIATGTPVLVTQALADRLPPQVDQAQRNVLTIDVKDDPMTLLSLPQEKLDALREPMLKPFGLSLKAPARVAFYPFADGSWVLENFNDHAVSALLNGEAVELTARGWKQVWK